MKLAKTLCVAIGFLAGASLHQAALAQDSPKQQARAPEAGNEVAQNQNQGGSTDRSSEGSKQQPGQNNSNRQGQVNGQPGNQNRNLLQNVRKWNQIGARGEFNQWNQHLPGNNQNLFWRYGGPDSGDWFTNSGASQDLNLGVADDSLREHLNLPKDQGIVVISVNPHSSAAQAGIQQNDILLMLGDRSLGKPEDLYDRLNEVGEKPVSLVLLRSGSRKTIQVQPKIRVTLNPVVVKVAPREYWIGISVTAVDPTLRAQIRLSQPHAVIVNQVVPDSPAAKAGITLHEIIVTIDGQPIVDPQDVAKRVQAKGGKPIELELIGKGRQPRKIVVTPARRQNTETSQAKAGDTLNVVTSYDIVGPGVVYPSNFYVTPRLDDLANTSWQLNALTDQSPPDPGQALTRRLDTLDSDLKELRKLVEEVQKSAATIIESQKSRAGTTND